MSGLEDGNAATTFRPARFPVALGPLRILVNAGACEVSRPMIPTRMTLASSPWADRPMKQIDKAKRILHRSIKSSPEVWAGRRVVHAASLQWYIPAAAFALRSHAKLIHSFHDLERKSMNDQTN